MNFQNQFFILLFHVTESPEILPFLDLAFTIPNLILVASGDEYIWT